MHGMQTEDKSTLMIIRGFSLVYSVQESRRMLSHSTKLQHDLLGGFVEFLLTYLILTGPF